jgi:hypothetical protein
MHPRVRAALLAGIALSAALLGPAAHAETSPSDKALAETLFRDARKAMQKKDYAKACPLLAESHRLDPALGTLLNLAVCHQQEGKTATAWAEFNSAARIAGKTGDMDRATLARDKATALESILSKIVIDVPQPQPEMEIKLDGRAIGEAAWDRALPTDPGEHKLLVSAPGWEAETIELHVPPGPSTQHVDVTLHKRLAESARPAASTSASAVPVIMPVMTVGPGESTQQSTLRTVGWIAGAAGIVGIGVGSYLGLRALSKQSVVEDNCKGAACNQTGYDADHDAHIAATWSTVAFGVGVVGLAAGAWLLIAPPGRKTAWHALPVAGPSTAGVQLGTQF